ncbi:MAG: four helix bundle protein [Anaerolineales bacterium]
MAKGYKFQKLYVYQMALDYVDCIYSITNQLPDRERYNLVSQTQRAATSIVLNVAEGSTGQSNAEQGRYLSYAIRSYLETIACFDIIERREYFPTNELNLIRLKGHKLFVKLIAFQKSLN